MTKKSIILVQAIILLLLLSACRGTAPEVVEALDSPNPELIQPTNTVKPTATAAQPTTTPRPFSPSRGGLLISDKNEFFTAAGACVSCHKQNIDQAGNDVSIGDYWRSTMMANAAKDPYYLAGVSINIERYPAYDAAIQSKCSTCHMPMAHVSDMFYGEESEIFGEQGYLNAENTLHKLASDGVSCTACHQIQDQEMGEFASFSGGFTIDQDPPMGSRILFGRFDLQQASQNMMSKSSGFISLKSDHLLESEMCATCHNLYTHYVLADGTFSDEWFPEQTPYSEWLHSDFATQATCQDCHMPPAEGSVTLTNLGPGGPRSPFAKHSFAGGNTYMLATLRDFGGEYGVQAGPEHLEPSIERNLLQLQTETGELEISPPSIEGATLSFDLDVSIHSGHKFPTGYPSRRAWLHIKVIDSNGMTIFESGAPGMDGSILGNENDQDATAFEPHYEEINSGDQVQIYEAIIQDVEGSVTTVLLAAASYVKDNRLLPGGFDKNSATEDIQPYGRAVEDADFSAGGDTVRYRIDVGEATGPFLIEAELLFQSISYRWAEDVRAYDNEQALAFSEYYSVSPNLPVLIAVQSAASE